MSDISSSLQEVLIRPAIWTIEASVAAWYFLFRAKPIISPVGPDPVWGLSWFQNMLLGTYTVLSFVLSIATIFHTGIVAGLCLFAVSIISLTATGIIKYSIVTGNKQQKLLFPIIAIIFLAFGYWLSKGLSVHLIFGQVSGLTWEIIGAMIGMFIPALWVDKWPSELKRKSELQSEQLTADAAYSAYQRKNYQTALKISLPLAEHGDASAQHNIGMMYYDGKGVRQNYSEALKWLHKAAQQGLASAEYNIGLMYDIGQGVPQDYLEALKWYRKATEQGNADALTSVGMMHYSGKGVTKDYSEALQWYRKAAEQGNGIAQNNIGHMYREGRGVSQDYVRAYMWFYLAAEQGQVIANKNRDLLAKKMTPEQITQAKEMAKQYGASHFKNFD